MVCPFKKNLVRKNRNGYEPFGRDDPSTRVEIEFGECDQDECMAYYKPDLIGKCRLMEVKNDNR